MSHLLQLAKIFVWVLVYPLCHSFLENAQTMLMDAAALCAARLHNSGAWDYVCVAAMLQGILGDLPGWPLVSSLSKMQLQQPHQQQLHQQQTSSAAMDGCDKCEKCNQLFFSPLNYRRHARVHRRTLGPDKEDVTKEKTHLMAFFSKLSSEEATDLLSLKEFSIEDFSGDAAMKELTALVESRRGISGAAPIVPSNMLKAGTTLLGMATGKGPLSSECREELFESLHEATEGTFLRGGTGIAVLRFVYQGGAKRVASEQRNLVAHLAFLLEHKLVQAWMADKEAEALRCQQALVEEEEAAQQKRAKIQERKRAKKIRLKEAKDREKKGSGNINEYVDGELLPEGSSSGAGREGGGDEEMGLESPNSAEVQEALFSVAGRVADSSMEGSDQWKVQQAVRSKSTSDEPCFRGSLKDNVANPGSNGGADRGGVSAAIAAGDLDKDEGGKRNSSMFGGEIEAPQLKKLAELATRAPESQSHRAEDIAAAGKTREGPAARAAGSHENASGQGEGGDLGEGRASASALGPRKVKFWGSGGNIDDLLECGQSSEYGGRSEKASLCASTTGIASIASAKRGAHPHSEDASFSVGFGHHPNHSRKSLHPCQKVVNSSGGSNSCTGENQGGMSGAVDLSGAGSGRTTSAGSELSKGGPMADDRLGRGERSDSARARGSNSGPIDSPQEDRAASGRGDAGSGKAVKLSTDGGAGGGSAGSGSGSEPIPTVSNQGFLVGPDSEFPPLPKAQMPVRGRKASLGSSDAIGSLGIAGSGHKYRVGAEASKHPPLDSVDGKTDSNNVFTTSNGRTNELGRPSRNAGCMTGREKSGEKGNEGKGGHLGGREPTAGEHEGGGDRRAAAAANVSAPAFVSGVIVVGQIPVVLTSGWEGRRTSGGMGQRAGEGQEHGLTSSPWISKGGGCGENNAVGLVVDFNSFEDSNLGRETTVAPSEKEHPSHRDQSRTPAVNKGSSCDGGGEDICGGTVIGSVQGLVIGDIVTPVKLEMGNAKDVVPGEEGENQDEMVYEQQQPPCCGTVHPTVLGRLGGHGGSSMCLGMQGEVLPIGVCLTAQSQPLASPYLPWGINVQPSAQVSVRTGVAIPAQGLYTPVPHCVPHNAVHVPISMQMTDGGLGMGVGLGVSPVGVLHMQRGADGGSGITGQMTLLEGGRPHDLPVCEPPILGPHGLQRSKGDNGIEPWGHPRQSATPKNMTVPTQVQSPILSQSHSQGAYPGQPQVQSAISRHGYPGEGSPLRTGMATNVNAPAQSGCPGEMVAVGHPVWQCEAEPRGGRIAHGSSGVMLENKRRWDGRGQDSRLSRQVLWGSQHGKPWPTKVWRAVGVVGSQGHGEGRAVGDNREEGNAAGGQEMSSVLESCDDSLGEEDDDTAASASEVRSPQGNARNFGPSEGPLGIYGQGHIGEERDGDCSRDSLSHPTSQRREFGDVDSLLFTTRRVEIDETGRDLDVSVASGEGEGECLMKGLDYMCREEGTRVDDSCVPAVDWEYDRSSEPKARGGEEANADSGARVWNVGAVQDSGTGDWRNSGGKELRWERRWRPSSRGNGSYHAARFLSERWAAAIEDSEALLYNGDVSDGEEPIPPNSPAAGSWGHNADVSNHNEQQDCALDVCISSGSRGSEETSADAVDMPGGDTGYWGGGSRSRGSFGSYEGTRYTSRGGGRGRGTYRGDRPDSYGHYDGDMAGRNGSYYAERYYGVQGSDSERYRSKSGRGGPPGDRRGPVSAIGTSGASSMGVGNNYTGPGRRRGGAGLVERSSGGRWRSEIAAPYDHKAYARKPSYGIERES